MRPLALAAGLGGLGALLALCAALGAPWLCAEFALAWDGPRVGPKPALPIAGRWVDDYWLVEPLDAQTWAIGEPRYYQGNYSYLIAGRSRALLFDGGSGQRDIVPLVRSLTTLPVTVLPSHLHFDHVGALGRLDRTVLPDLPALRERAPEGRIRLGRYEFLGFVDGLPPRTVAVDAWWRPDSIVELGGRRLALLHVPGHTPDSVVLHEPARRALYAGDFVYPSQLYAFLPGASRSAYRASTLRLLEGLAPETVLFTAHLGDTTAGIAAPRLAVADLRALAITLQAIEDGSAVGEGLFPRLYPVRDGMVFATGLRWNNR